MVTPRSKKLLLAGLVSAFALQTAFVYTDERTGPIDEAALRGRDLWHAYGCQVCHQLYGQGGFLGPDLTNSVGRLDSTRLHSLLTVGSGQMPAFQMDANDIADVNAYLHALDRPDLGRGQLRLGNAERSTSPWARFERAATPMMTQEARRGWEAMQSRPCTACHQPLTQSAVGAPDLSRAVERLDEAVLRDVLTDGRPAAGMPPPVPAFSADELTAVETFLQWLNERRDSVNTLMRDERPRRTVRWSDLPWWEYR